MDEMWRALNNQQMLDENDINLELLPERIQQVRLRSSSSINNQFEKYQNDNKNDISIEGPQNHSDRLSTTPNYLTMDIELQFPNNFQCKVFSSDSTTINHPIINRSPSNRNDLIGSRNFYPNFTTNFPFERELNEINTIQLKSNLCEMDIESSSQQFRTELSKKISISSFKSSGNDSSIEIYLKDSDKSSSEEINLIEPPLTPSSQLNSLKPYIKHKECLKNLWDFIEKPFDYCSCPKCQQQEEQKQMERKVIQFLYKYEQMDSDQKFNQQQSSIKKIIKSNLKAKDRRSKLKLVSEQKIVKDKLPTKNFLNKPKRHGLKITKNTNIPKQDEAKNKISQNTSTEKSKSYLSGSTSSQQAKQPPQRYGPPAIIKCTCLNCQCKNFSCNCRRWNRECNDLCNCNFLLCRNHHPNSKVILKLQKQSQSEHEKNQNQIKNTSLKGHQTPIDQSSLTLSIRFNTPEFQNSFS